MSKIVGIIAQTSIENNKKINFVNQNYIKIIEENGATPIIIPVTKELETYVELCDAFLFVGGRDIHPSMYSEELKIKYSNISLFQEKKYYRNMHNKPLEEQDIYELNFYNLIKKRKKSILGICRGAQIINVAENGTLFQELGEREIEHYFSSDGWINYHEIFVEKNSRLFQILKKESITISSVHHQGIKELSSNLNASAYSKDNLVEIFEGKDDFFLMGIQGHIENICKNYDYYKNIIKKFINNEVY